MCVGGGNILKYILDSSAVFKLHSNKNYKTLARHLSAGAEVTSNHKQRTTDVQLHSPGSITTLKAPPKPNQNLETLTFSSGWKRIVAWARLSARKLAMFVIDSQCRFDRIGLSVIQPIVASLSHHVLATKIRRHSTILK